MAITLQQLKDLGFLPAKRSSLYKKKYDTLIFPLNKTDHLYLGYNQYTKEINYKAVWKSFKHPETKERITYKVINLGETGYDEMKEFLRISLENASVAEDLSEEMDQGKMQTYTIDPANCPGIMGIACDIQPDYNYTGPENTMMLDNGRTSD